jgi:hypothetical protein
MTTVQIDTADLRALGKALKGVDKTIRQNMFKAAKRVTQPVKNEIKQSARTTLPSGGGLNEWVAALGTKTKTSLSGRNVGITITGTLDNKKKTVPKTGRGRRKTRRSGTFGAIADIRAINRGRVMHPAWGRGPLIGPQMVKTGFWTRPLEGETTTRARREMTQALEETAEAVAAAMRT